MAIIIDENKMLDEAIFKHEDRIKSPLSRFADKNHTSVRYYHINNEETTTDGGWKDVEDILSNNSPIKFKMIKDFPIYGIEQIVIALQDGDQGLDGSYEGEATILPGTIVPSPNDYFIIPILRDSYVFRVTEVSYDNIMPDNYYKINFILEYIDNEKEQALEDQTNEKYTCVLHNIGTDERCLIEDEYFDELKKIDSIYDEMVKTYLTFYYNNKYNCLLGDLYEGNKLYDPFQTLFINKHSLFNKKDDLKTVILSEQFEDPKRLAKYEKTIYRIIEKKDFDKLNTFPYVTFPGVNNKETSFYRWVDKNIEILDIQKIPKNIDESEYHEMMSKDFLNIIKFNGDTESPYAKLIVKYLRNEEKVDFSDIKEDLLDELRALDDANLEIFFYTPIILYIIKEMITEYMKKE